MYPLPLLYSFRRCPYAIRARMALYVAGVQTRIIEVSLKDKPAAMLALSAKATVPVLQLVDGRVLDESLEIMCWALAQNDPQGWLASATKAAGDDGSLLIDGLENTFKPALDRYKYPQRFAGSEPELARAEALAFLECLEVRLQSGFWLSGARAGVVDVALFPFVRQFAGVEPDWFVKQPLLALRRWLQHWLDSECFTAVMRKNREFLL